MLFDTAKSTVEVQMRSIFVVTENACVSFSDTTAWPPTSTVTVLESPDVPVPGE